jgi:hypothetical protein
VWKWNGWTVAAVVLALCGEAHAARLWDWRYDAAGIAAAGTLTTEDAPDPAGFYRITAISGQRNGSVITGLQQAGTPIPGNEPYAVDNRIRAETPQLTKAGFGFALQDRSHANPFFADFQAPPAYLEFHAEPAGGHTELPVTFKAEPAGRR